GAPASQGRPVPRVLPRDQGMKARAEALPTQEMLINMGPQHPSTHGVLRVILRTDGEVVVNARPDMGYLHRALEKIGERVTYAQFMPFTDRLHHLSPLNSTP